MLKLRRLRVERFRSLARETELSFSDGINVLLGQNGTGKTTLLELISMVVRSDFSTLAKEEFAIEYELSVPERESLIVVVRNERVVMEQDQTPPELSQREVFRPSAEVLVGADRRRLLRFLPEHGFSIGDAPPKAPAGIRTPVDTAFLLFFLGQVSDFDQRFILPLVQAGSAHRFDESLDLFRTATRTGELPGELFVDGRTWVMNPFAPPFFPNSIVKELMVAHEPNRPSCSSPSRCRR